MKYIICAGLLCSVSACSNPFLAQQPTQVLAPQPTQVAIISYLSQDMKSGISQAGFTRVPENANSGQKLYLNPANNAFMLCSIVDEVTDTCLNFYRN